MPETFISGEGWLPFALAAGKFTPYNPPTLADGEAWLCNVTLGEAAAITASTVLALHTDMVLDITVDSGVTPAGWLITHGYCVVQNEADKDNVFNTLTAPIAAFDPDDTLIITPRVLGQSGSWALQVPFNRPGTIRGYSRKHKVSVGIASGDGVTVSAAGVCVLEDLYIGGAIRGVEINQPSGSIIVQGVKTASCTDSGIWLTGSSDVTIMGCEDSDSWFAGIRFSGPSGTVKLHGNTIAGGPVYGIYPNNVAAELINNMVIGRGLDAYKLAGNCTGSNNISDDGTAPGTGVVSDDEKFNFYPFLANRGPDRESMLTKDYRVKSGAGGSGDGAGINIAGQLYDIEGRTFPTSGARDVGASHGNPGLGNTLPDTPSTPTVVLKSFISSTAIVTVSGSDAAATNTLLYSTDGLLFIVGNTRIGNGDITQPGLDDTIDYVFEIQSSSTTELKVKSLPSNPVGFWDSINQSVGNGGEIRVAGNEYQLQTFNYTPPLNFGSGTMYVQRRDTGLQTSQVVVSGSNTVSSLPGGVEIAVSVFASDAAGSPIGLSNLLVLKTKEAPLGTLSDIELSWRTDCIDWSSQLLDSDLERVSVPVDVRGMWYQQRIITTGQNVRMRITDMKLHYLLHGLGEVIKR